MRTWVLIKPDNRWPYDLICVELGDGRLLFIHEDDKWDIEPAEHGLPTEKMWYVFDA